MEFDPVIIYQYGLLGIMLAWFMFRTEKKLDESNKLLSELRSAVDNLAEIMMRK